MVPDLLWSSEARKRLLSGVFETAGTPRFPLLGGARQLNCSFSHSALSQHRTSAQCTLLCGPHHTCTLWSPSGAGPPVGLFVCWPAACCHQALSKQELGVHDEEGGHPPATATPAATHTHKHTHTRTGAAAAAAGTFTARIRPRCPPVYYGTQSRVMLGVNGHVTAGACMQSVKSHGGEAAWVVAHGMCVCLMALGWHVRHR